MIGSLERIQSYLEIEQEAKPSADGVPPAYWPSSGNIRVENLCARYSRVSEYSVLRSYSQVTETRREGRSGGPTQHLL